MNKITPADISDPQEVIARAEALSAELGTPITPGFEALVFKASRGIEDIYELTYIRKDGSRFPAVVSVTALRDALGAIIGYLLIGTDNTARKQAEEALLKAGALQRAIFNSANFSSIATDAKGVIQIFNVGAERMLGYTAAEVMNKITPADISDPPEVIARAEALSRELGTLITPGFEALVFKASRGIEDIYELTYIRKDGSRFPAVVSVTALRDALGAIIGYLLIGTDNTARKQADDALRKSETQLQTIVENISEAVVVSDLNGQLLHFNQAALDMLGYASRDEGRRKFIELADTFELSDMDGAAWPVDQWPLARILRGEKLHDVEARMRRIHADWQRVYSFGGTVAHDAGGRPLMAVVTFSDITARIEAEGKISRWNTELEERIADRTAELAESNSDLEAFTYSVSHDLRAPLRAIDGFSRILETEYTSSLSEEAKRFLGLVRSNVQQMGQLVEDLLSLCRHGRQALATQIVKPDEIARQAWKDLTQWPDGRSIAFEVQKLEACRADPALLKQVFVNLLSNAIKFTRTRENTCITVGAEKDNAGEVVYFVKDNGIGFDMRYVHKLFGVFQRLHRAEDYAGTGVGLAIVHRIIKRHGGRVWAQSEPDKGTTISFTLGSEKS
jgi:PAS domain S-box-containing protein